MPIQRSTRIWFAVGLTLVIAAVALAVADASVPPSVLVAEAGLFTIGILYSVASVAMIGRFVAYGTLGLTITDERNHVADEHNPANRGTEASCVPCGGARSRSVS